MFSFDHTRFENVPRELVSISERETIVVVILFVVNWSQCILIYAVFVSSHLPDGQPQGRNSSRQVTGAPISPQSSSTAETCHGVRDSPVIREQDHVLTERLCKKNTQSDMQPLDAGLRRHSL